MPAAPPPTNTPHSIDPETLRQLEAEVEIRRQRLEEAEATLQAIRSGQADAIMLDTGAQTSVLTLGDADWPYRRLIESMAEGAMVMTLDGTILWLNPRMSKLLRTAPRRILGTSAIARIAETSRVTFHELMGIEEATVEPIDLTFRASDGADVPARVTASRLEVDGDKLICMLVTDISAERAAASQLSRQTDELARSNAELEQFAYVASHDLSEPLRAVAGFVQLLAERYRGRLDDEADEFIEFTLTGVHRMQTLIRDLLTYSRVSRVEYELEMVDTNELVAEVAHTLQADASVHWSALPTVFADATQLRRVFQNLIDNALKFVPPERDPQVNVSAVDRDGYWEFSIADNGIGVAEQYQERIFKSFQRLHSQEEYPGTGLGLSICQRILQRHGGRIWLTSTEGEGSTFVFTIPEKVAA